MRRLFLALLALVWASTAQAQCIGVSGVNTVPQTGVVCQQDSIVPTYAATSIGLVPGTAPTDIACIYGSATRTIRVKQVRVSGVAGTAINITAVLLKRASANTGGTLATSTALPVAYPMDSTFAAATATLQAWTVNPTIVDTSPGIINAATVFLPATGTASGAGAQLFDVNDFAMSPIVLRGVAQNLCVNLNGVTAPSSGLMTVSFVWNEQVQ